MRLQKMPNPTLSSPKYASHGSQEFQWWEKQKNRKQRNKSQPPTERFFRRNEGTTDHISIPDAVLIEGDVVEITYLAPISATTSNEYIYDGGALEAGLLMNSSGRINLTNGWGSSISIDGVVAGELNPIYPIDGELHIITVVASGAASGLIINTLCSTLAGSFGYSGIVADFKIISSGAITRSYTIDDNSDNIKDSISGFDGTVINGNNDDWSKFFKDGDDWVRNSFMYDWTEASQLDDWVLAQSTGVVSGDRLELTSTDNDPQMATSVVFNLVGITNTLLMVRAKGVSGGNRNHQMFYRTVASPPFSGDKSVFFRETSASDPEVTRTGPDAQGYFTYAFDMSAEAAWISSSVIGFRFDFTAGETGTVTDVDLIKTVERLVGA